MLIFVFGFIKSTIPINLSSANLSSPVESQIPTAVKFLNKVWENLALLSFNNRQVIIIIPWLLNSKLQYYV